MGGDIGDLLLLGRCLGVDESGGVLNALREELGVAGRDWRPLVALANRHQIVPALWLSLCRKRCQSVLPEDLQYYLAEILQRNARRNALLRQQACETVTALNGAGIQPIVLKGGLQLFESGFDRAGRIMADLDFLVPRSSFEAAVNALRRIGYSLLGTTFNRSEHSLTLFRAGVLATIDLHRDLGPQRTLLPADAAITASVPLAIDGLELRSLSPTHRVLHAIVNASVNEPHYRMATIALCRLYELMLLSQRRTFAIDWNAVCRGMANEGLEHAVPALLCLTRQLLGMPLPAAIRETMHSRLYVRRYFLQSRFMPLMVLGRSWGRLTHTFARVRIDYFYPCGSSPWRLTVSRLRHAGTILHRRDIKAIEIISRDLRAD
jgi:Uncharacterised nucleotidyltransferase